MFSACVITGTASASAQDDRPPDSPAPALVQQPASEPRPTVEIYGFTEADSILDFKRNNPDWYDVNRPTTLPTFAGEFGNDGHFYLSPRQTRFGVTSTLPTPAGDVTATLEMDMLGTGPDAGLTTIRLRHAWGRWKRIGAGQTFSQFMNPDVYPNRLDPWGPSAMPTLRNIQVFWRVYEQGPSNLTVALENPGASADDETDPELFAERIDLQHINVRFPAPDVTGHYRVGGPWGHVQAGGVLRYIAWDDRLRSERLNLDGHVRGWGVNLSSVVNAGSNDVLRMQVVYGRAIENYINDAPIDVGPAVNPGDSVQPVVGRALPVFGIVAYVDHTWVKAWSTSAGYSRVDISNSNAQTPVAFKVGQYATVNLLCTPAQNVLMGAEFQWAQRQNFSDGWIANDYRFVFSFKYSFSYKVSQ